jgi:WD40 repeat protein
LQGDHPDTVAFSPLGDKFAYSRQREVLVVSIRTGAVVSEIASTPHDRVRAIAFSPAGRSIACVFEHEVSVFRAHDGARLYSIPHYGLDFNVSASPNAVTFLEDGVLALATDNGVELWDCVAVRKKNTIAEHSRINAVTATRTKMVVSVSDNGTILFSDESTGETIRRIEARSTDIESITISADGRIVAVGDGATLRVWYDSHEVEGHRHEDRIQSLAITPDATLLVTASGDRVRRWELAPADR